MNLIIDAGNTSVKLAIFKQDQLIAQMQTPSANFSDAVSDLFERHPDIDNAIVASVSFLEEQQLNSIRDKCELLQVSHTLKTPFKNKYTSPETLGADRIALAASAILHYPDQSVLIVDAGTCVTYDMVTQDGEYLGGSISPGLQMRYDALQHFTNRLPALEPEDYPDFIGDTTQNSIHSGVINGICREIEGVIDQYLSRYPHLTVILTGGDAQFLSKRLKKPIFAHSNFLLEGLNFLLENNKR